MSTAYTGTANDIAAGRSAGRTPVPVGEGGVIFAAALALNLAAWVVVSRLGMLTLDPMVRTVDAWRVLADGVPGLARLAFTWPPLPLVLELPLLLIPPLRTTGFSGQVLTVLLGAVSCVGLLRALAALGIGRRMRRGMVAAFMLNPLVLFASAGGAAEVVAMTATTWSMAYLVSWAVTRHLQDFAISSFSLALAVLADDAGISQAALTAAAVLIILSGRPMRSGAGTALTLAYLTPVAAALLFWVFLRLFVIGGSLPIEAGKVATVESTYPSLLVIPLGVILVGYVLSHVSRSSGLASLAALALLLGSDISTIDTIRQSAEWGPWTERLAWQIQTGSSEPTWATERQIAAYLTERRPGRGVLIEGAEAYPILFFSGHPEWFVTAGEPGFEQVIRQPVGRVDYVLLRASPSAPAGNRISQAYPSLFAAGAAWASFEREWPSASVVGSPWRLYYVHEP